MKGTKMFLCLMGLLSSTSFARTPSETAIPVDHIFSPQGFDSNDTSEVVVSGFLPNLCYKAPFTEVSVKGNKVEIAVKAMRYESSNYCPEVLVPFVSPVKLGVLDKGQYEIVVNGNTMYEKKGQLAVEESTSNAVDEFVYANIEYVEKAHDKERTIKLRGYNPSACFVLDKIEFVDNKTDTYSVLPKMKQVSDFCPMKMVPFIYEAKVPNNLKADKVLLHVRVMDGKSVNTIFSNVAEEF